jgi:brefeldin A-resistance guanine nucleotide exchange factor 1
MTWRSDVNTLPLSDLLAPFFAIIRSPLSTGPITSTALSSLHSLFVCGLISPASVNLDAALIELSSTVSHCKFEASDSSGDEVVLLRIMTVIQDCMCGDVGKSLGDIEVCEMLETVLTTCCQIRLSGNSSFLHLSLPVIAHTHPRNSSSLRRNHHALSSAHGVLQTPPAKSG